MNIVITADGFDLLTGELPKDPDEVEALCGEQPLLGGAGT